MNNHQKFELCWELASKIVAKHRSEAPKDCDPQNSGIIAAMAVVGLGSAAFSANSASKQAGAQQDAINRVISMFKKSNPGASALGGVESLLEGFSLEPVDPMAFKDAGFDLADEGSDFLRGQGLENFAAAIGEENLAGFNQFLSSSLERANFNFDSIPDDILATLDSSALSQASGGPIGRAEEISVRNRMALQQQGQQGLFQGVQLRGGFLPDPINPVDTTLKLAEFEQMNNQMALAEAGFQLDALKMLYSGEMDQFNIQSGLFGIADPRAGVGSAAAASGLNTASQMLAMYGMMNSGSGRSSGTQSTPTQNSTQVATAA